MIWGYLTPLLAKERSQRGALPLGMLVLWAREKLIPFCSLWLCHCSRCALPDASARCPVRLVTPPGRWYSRHSQPPVAAGGPLAACQHPSSGTQAALLGKVQYGSPETFMISFKNQSPRSNPGLLIGHVKGMFISW